MRLLERIRFLTRRVVSRNNLWRARRNVAHHYDLDHRLYELFLDADLQYSCAYFERPDMTPRGGAARQEAARHGQACSSSRTAACSTSARAGAASGFT